MSTGGSGSSATVKIVGDNKDLKKTLDDSKASLTKFANESSSGVSESLGEMSAVLTEFIQHFTGVEGQAASQISSIISQAAGKTAAFMNFATATAETFGVSVGVAVAGIGVAVAGVVAGIVVAAYEFVKFAYEGVQSAIQVESQFAVLNQTVENLHGTLGVTTKSLENLASSMAKGSLTTVSDLQKVEQILLNIGHISSSDFPRAIQIAKDLAAARGVKPSQVAGEVAQMFANPTTTIGRRGNPKEEELIRRLMASDQKGLALEVRLNIAGTDFKGMEEAVRNTFAGQILQLRSAFEDLGTSFGQILLPVLKLIVPVIQTLADMFRDLADAIEFVTKPISLLLDLLGRSNVAAAAKMAAQSTATSTFGMIPGLGPVLQAGALLKSLFGGANPADQFKGKEFAQEAGISPLQGNIETLDALYNRISSAAAGEISVQDVLSGNEAAQKERDAKALEKLESIDDTLKRGNPKSGQSWWFLMA